MNTGTRILIGLVVTMALAGGIVAGTMVRDSGTAAATAPGSGEAPSVRPEPDFDSPAEEPCTTGATACSFEFGEDLSISIGDDVEVVERQGGGFDVVGDVIVPTAAGPVELIGADLEIGIGDDGEATIVGGTAQVPFPTTGILANAVVNHLPEGLVGIDFGRNLRHLGAHLQDDREYVFFHFDGGLDIDLPFGGTEGFEAVPPTLSVPTGFSATLVLDPADPYLYVGGPCPGLGDEDAEKNRDNNKGDRDDNSGPNNRSDDDNRVPETPKEDEDALIELEPEGAAPGEDCGIGFSLQGNIPAPRVEGTDPFFGHIVVDGIIPLYAAMELDGTVVLEVREDKVRTTGTGDLSATIPLIDRLIDIQIPLGSAGVDIEAGATRISVGFEGRVGGQDPTYVLPLLDVPVTLPSDGSIELTALLSFVRGADGVFRIDPASHAEITGTLGLGYGSIGEVIGVDLDDLVTADALLRIDPSGFTVRGETQTHLHPALATEGRLVVGGRVSFERFADSYLTMEGEVTVAGVTLGAASIDLSQNGLFVTGTLDNLLSKVELAGSIGPDGVNLSGSSSVEFPLDVVKRLAEGAITGIDTAQAEVDRIQAEIDRLRVEIRADRKARSRDFQNARDALTAAQAEVDELQGNIDINNGKIRTLRSRISDEEARFGRLNFVEQAAQSVGHLAQLGVWAGEIEVLELANTTQDGLRLTATGVLEGAKSVLTGVEAGLDALPVDTDPRIVALFVTKETATFALETAKSVAQTVSIGGTLRGEITWQLGTDGVAASLVAEYCDGGCTTLVGGSVVLTPTPMACIEVLGITDACVTL